MKKLLALLVMLTASLGSWAFKGDFDGVSFDDRPPHGIQQFINVSTPGALASWWNEHKDEHGPHNELPAEKTSLVITGKLNAADFAVLDVTIQARNNKWNQITTVDLSGVTEVVGENPVTVISNMNLTNAQTVVLPSGLTKEQVASLKNEAKDVVAGITGETIQHQIPHYTFTVGNSTFEYTGDLAEGQTSVDLTDYPLMADLTLVEGYPKYTYTFRNVEYETSELRIVNYWSQDHFVPETLEVELTPTGNENEYTYTFMSNWSEQTLTYHGQANRIEDGKYYLNVANNPPDNGYAWGMNDYGTKYRYTYTDTNGDVQTVDYTAPTDQIQVGTYSGTVNLTTTIETQSEFVVDGMAAYVNTAGTLSTVASTIYDSSVLTQYRGSENITIMGNINNDDLTELSATNFASVEYLSMRDAVLDGDITTISSKGTAAIILPEIKVGENSSRNVNKQELGAIQAQGGWTPVFHCLSYFDKADDTKMYIYAFDDAVGKLGNDVSNNTAITFIPMYDTDGEFAQFMGYQFSNTAAFEPFRQALGELPAISMDLSIVNQMLTPDFTGLDANTHYLTVMGNVNPSSSGNPFRPNYDFTGEASTSVYDYPSTVWVVSAYRVDEADAFVLDENGNKIQRVDANGNPVVDENGNPKYQRTGYATNIHYAGKFLSATEPTNLIYVRDRDDVTGADNVTSLLDGAKNYFTNEQLYATRQIFIGSYTEAEIAAIDNDIHGNVFDFMAGTSFETVTVGEGDDAKSLDCVVNLDNDHVKYIVLPDNHEADINATSTDNCSFSANCSSLLSVGAYNAETNTLTTWSSAPGNVRAVTTIIRPQVAESRGNGLTCATLNNVVMSGYLNRNDINTVSGASSGLEGAVVQTADLSNAFFPTQTDMVFCPQDENGGAGWDDKIVQLLLPTDPRQTLIPDHSLHGAANLNELCVPYNYEDIGVDAFGLMGAKKITTTDAEGNLIDNGENSFTLSSNLKSIGTMAFWTGNKSLRDVYVLATTAPKCAANAFNSENYCGNIGFEGNFKHPVTRENYHNGDLIWFTIFHFPSDITEAEAKKYTDIDREYSLIDETSAFDGKGQLKHWPNHSEISRAYDQALAGKTWNQWVYMTEADYNITLTALPAVLQAKGYTAEEAAAYVQHYADLGYDGSKYELRVTDGGNVDGIGTVPTGEILATYYTEVQSGVTPETCDFYDYIGWHQFVLTDYYRFKEIEVDDTPKAYTTLNYYTLCFPFDLTRQEVIDLIGAPCKNGNTLDGKTLTADAFPVVYTLKSVVRNQASHNINLGFSKELMAQAKNGKDITVTATGWNYDNALKTKNGEEVFLKGGFPYLIKPIVPAGTSFSNLAEYMMSISDLTAADLGWKEETSDGGYISVPYKSQGVISTDEDGNQLTWIDGDGNPQDYYYFFQGTYENEDLPIYAYYLGQKNGVRSFFYDTTGTRKWNRFSAIIGGKCPTLNPIAYIGFDHGNSSKTVSTVSIFMRNADDSFTAGNDVKVNFTFEGEDGFDNAVTIESINGESVINNLEGDVYTVTGQFVGKSLNGVAKGLYIINGKKVLVK